MKNILASAIALLAAGSLAASASAASLSPGNGTFTGTGVVSLKKGSLTLTCVLNLTGHITNGIGTIDTATFTGSGGLCSLFHKIGTWTVIAVAPGTAVITGVAITSSLTGTCGPGSVNTTISNTGLFTFANAVLPPDCQINGSVQTSPAVIVVP